MMELVEGPCPRQQLGWKSYNKRLLNVFFTILQHLRAEVSVTAYTNLLLTEVINALVCLEL
jgi:hypothetical protein